MSSQDLWQLKVRRAKHAPPSSPPPSLPRQHAHPLLFSVQIPIRLTLAQDEISSPGDVKPVHVSVACSTAQPGVFSLGSDLG